MEFSSELKDGEFCKIIVLWYNKLIFIVLEFKELLLPL